jgi:hypothetical protein
MILGIDVGQKHLGVAVWDGTTVRHWAVWDSPGSQAADLWTCLREHATPAFLDGVTHVVIERQPSKNPTMTRIMHYLEFYFARDRTVSLQDPKHKLIFAATTPWFPDAEEATARQWTYHRRKKLAVLTAAQFLEATDQPLRAVFDAAKKKDDLADALLTAMAYERLRTSTKPKTPTHKKKIVARAPTPRQRDTGKLSPSNVKYLLADVTPATVQTVLARDKTLARALKKHFGTYDAFIRDISG